MAATSDKSTQIINTGIETAHFIHKEARNRPKNGGLRVIYLNIKHDKFQHIIIDNIFIPLTHST